MLFSPSLCLSPVNLMWRYPRCDINPRQGTVGTPPPPSSLTVTKKIHQPINQVVPPEVDPWTWCFYPNLKYCCIFLSNQYSLPSARCDITPEPWDTTVIPTVISGGAAVRGSRSCETMQDQASIARSHLMSSLISKSPDHDMPVTWLS